MQENPNQYAFHCKKNMLKFLIYGPLMTPEKQDFLQTKTNHFNHVTPAKQDGNATRMRGMNENEKSLKNMIDKFDRLPKIGFSKIRSGFISHWLSSFYAK